MTRKVKIAEFKSKLSKHLRSVRGGDELIILDRDRPVARVAAYEKGTEASDFRIRSARIRGCWKQVRWPSLPVKADVVRILREDRDKR
ncbi:MAG TPA: type II toxin-antitoxin system Phd/YefM family antitoxin [bacterium]|nr:type II toxin-antitoxin system Phd/YefM family antitoxin [bacterium]